HRAPRGPGLQRSPTRLRVAPVRCARGPVRGRDPGRPPGPRTAHGRRAPAGLGGCRPAGCLFGQHSARTGQGVVMTTATDRPGRRSEDPLVRQTKKATQLLVASARHSYDPRVDVNWDEPLEEGKWFLPEKRISLYGTELYDSLSMEQKLLLSREE